MAILAIDHQSRKTQFIEVHFKVKVPNGDDILSIKEFHYLKF